ncbi:hypothetical protein [Alloalcanivorax xenomutans]|uniref:hypothetical protein n=1 Tax=Alloalcanivorax xenomutans TaxID=1094342 RepID=UPI003BA9ACEC
MGKVGTASGEVNGSTAKGNTYVFSKSFFLTREKYINSNSKFLLANKRDVAEFAKMFVDDCKRDIRRFVKEIIGPRNMLEFQLGGIDAGVRGGSTIHLLLRALILMKLLKHPDFEARLAEFKARISGFDEALKTRYYKKMDIVAQRAF